MHRLLLNRTILARLIKGNKGFLFIYRFSLISILFFCSAKVLFKPTAQPQFVTVSGSKGDIPSPIVLDPGRYRISVKTDRFLFLDYFVLLPAAYYESSILTKKIENPCELDNLALCRHYKYPAIVEYNPSYRPIVANGDTATQPTEFYEDKQHLELIHQDTPLPMITSVQPSLNYILDVPRTGGYIVLVDYVSDRDMSEAYIVHVNLDDGNDDEADGLATLYPCTYTTVCRQPVIDAESREKVFHLDITDLKAIQIKVQLISLDLKCINIFILKGDDNPRVAIKSLAIVPVEEWSIDLITPSPVCVMQNGKCIQTMYRSAPDSKKVILMISLNLLIHYYKCASK